MKLESLALTYEPGDLRLLDQQKLPGAEEWVRVESVEQMRECILALKVRGAPLIGVAASLSLAEAARSGIGKAEFLEAAQRLREARPTAVNLMVSIDRLVAATQQNAWAEAVCETAVRVFREDVELCEQIANNGQQFIADGDNILTHCNTGGLATAGVGTALGVIRKAHESGKSIHVWIDETRPLLQGGRLTAWELKKLGIPCTLICDNMAASLMAQGKIQRAIVGADRIATNGDFANKVGTYNVAILSFFHRIPFYVAAPYTTVDFDCTSGAEIPIEQRSAAEVMGVAGSFGSVQWAPDDMKTYNPAFDVTPADLVSAWILDEAALTQKEIQQGQLQKRRM